VCTERTSHQTATVVVHIGAGSRNEDLETSGTAYLLEKMMTHGTTSKNKTEINDIIERKGARFQSQTGRETTSYQVQSLKTNVPNVIKLLGDIISNSTLNPNEFDIVK